jgi:hypothetical protein
VLAELVKTTASMIAKKKETAWTKRVKELRQLCECSSYDSSDVKPIDPRVLLKQLQVGTNAQSASTVIAAPAFASSRTSAHIFSPGMNQ